MREPVDVAPVGRRSHRRPVHRGGLRERRGGRVPEASAVCAVRVRREQGGGIVEAIVAFLTARLDEDEEIARRAMFNNGYWTHEFTFGQETRVRLDFGPD